MKMSLALSAKPITVRHVMRTCEEKYFIQLQISLNVCLFQRQRTIRVGTLYKQILPDCV